MIIGAEMGILLMTGKGNVEAALSGELGQGTQNCSRNCIISSTNIFIDDLAVWPILTCFFLHVFLLSALASWSVEGLRKNLLRTGENSKIAVIFCFPKFGCSADHGLLHWQTPEQHFMQQPHEIVRIFPTILQYRDSCKTGV